jgi:hypothetical protein
VCEKKNARCEKQVFKSAMVGSSDSMTTTFCPSQYFIARRERERADDKRQRNERSEALSVSCAQKKRGIAIAAISSAAKLCQHTLAK